LTLGSSNAGTIALGSGDVQSNMLYPAFSTYRNATLSISNSTDTIIVFDTEDFDTDSAYNVSDGKFTVPSGKAGKYFFHAFTRYQYASSDLKNFNMQIEVNGSRVAQINVRGSTYTSISCSTLENLSAGDYVQIKVQHDIGSATEITSIAGYNGFSGFRIGT
jgi:hypothetical protein